MRHIALICSLVCALTPYAGWADATKPESAVSARLISDDLSDPIQATHAPGTPSRIVVVEREGAIRVLENGKLLTRKLLDIESIINLKQSPGLVGVAFPGNYHSSQVFYVNYIDSQGDTIIGRFTAGADETPDEESLTVVMKLAQAFPNSHTHAIAFGPDSFLYITSGDGGGGQENARFSQRLDSPFGKIFRIEPSLEGRYKIPADNPFHAQPKNLGEIWALGFRNPSHISFDRESGDLYLIDSRPDAATISVVKKGDNFGWGAACEPSACGHQKPIYKHRGATPNATLIGGVVYRGSLIPQLRGRYIFAEAGSGQLFTLVQAGGTWQHHPLMTIQGETVSSIGADADGEILITTREGSLFTLTRAG